MRRGPSSSPSSAAGCSRHARHLVAVHPPRGYFSFDTRDFQIFSSLLCALSWTPVRTQESSARLERTVRRDLEKEKELMQALLRQPAATACATDSDSADARDAQGE